ncbi:enhancer of yellow 2 transcription factor-like protein B [Parasitella parasitica]|nr:enhancer of yellow 2 transcription factor-like protein B [Parasitella parasitica]
MSDGDKMRTSVNRLFVESGEKDRLLQLLRARLSDSGWTDSLDAYSRDVIKAKNLQEISFEGLIREIGDHGRSTVSETIKKDLLESIKKFLDDHLG